MLAVTGRTFVVLSSITNQDFSLNTHKMTEWSFIITSSVAYTHIHSSSSFSSKGEIEQNNPQKSVTLKTNNMKPKHRGLAHLISLSPCTRQLWEKSHLHFGKFQTNRLQKGVLFLDNMYG